MTREEAYQNALSAIAKMQWNMSMILEAKAFEAEKVRNWLCGHVTTDSIPAHAENLSTTLKFHEQNVDLLDGLTKLCNGMNRNMKTIMSPSGDEDGDSDMSKLLSGFGDGNSD